MFIGSGPGIGPIKILRCPIFQAFRLESTNFQPIKMLEKNHAAKDLRCKLFKGTVPENQM